MPAPQNEQPYRIIRTARTLEEINEGVRLGYRPLVKRLEPSSQLSNIFAIYQHCRTGEMKVVSDLRDDEHLRLDYEMVLPFGPYYPYSFPSPYAAYLVPPDIQDGELVFLVDLIEDIVGHWQSQGGGGRLESYFATWVDGDFKIDFDPEKDAPQHLG